MKNVSLDLRKFLLLLFPMDAVEGLRNLAGVFETPFGLQSWVACCSHFDCAVLSGGKEGCLLCSGWRPKGKQLMNMHTIPAKKQTAEWQRCSWCFAFRALEQVGLGEISAVQVQEVSKAAQLSGLEWPQNDVLSSLGMHGENACF